MAERGHFAASVEEGDQIWLTVVTVVRNDVDALRVTLRSVAEQTATGVVHLVLDGASSDGTAEVALAAAVPGKVTVRSEPDRGIYDAMNKGVELAESPMLLYLNAGDRLATPQSLGEVQQAWRQQGFEWGRWPIIWIDQAGRPQRTRGRQSAQLDRRAFIAGRQPVLHQGTLMSRDLLTELGGFDVSYTIAADFDLMVRALVLGYTPFVGAEPLSLVDASGVSTLAWRRSLSEVARSQRSSGGLSRMSAGRHLLWRTGYVGARRAGRRLLDVMPDVRR